MKAADIVLVNGIVSTRDDARSVVQAVAVRDGVVALVGDSAQVRELIGPRTQTIDLRGRLVLPGFVDAHAHACMAADDLFKAVVYELPSVRDCVAGVARFAAAHPELPVIRGCGWSNTMAPGRGPRKEDLDAVESARPVVLESSDYHSVWVNSRALELAGIHVGTPDSPGGVIERMEGTGEPAGTLREGAVELVTRLLPEYTVEQYAEGIRHYQRDVAAPFGVTAVFDPMVTPGGAAVQAYERLAADGSLGMWVRAAMEMKPEDDVEQWLRVAVAERDAHRTAPFRISAAKFFADGVVEGHTAYLLDDYADRPGDRGAPLWGDAALARAFAAVDAAGFQIHVHAIGDAATAQTLDALAAVRAENGERDRRPGITHLQLVAPADRLRLAQLNVVAVTDPYWFVMEDYYFQLERPFLGPRADGQYPMRSFLEAGVTVAAASDYPVTIPPAPLVAIQRGVARRQFGGEAGSHAVLGPDERVTVDQMIDACTRGGAFALGLDGVIGSIEAGKSADLVVLDRDIRHARPAAIGEATVALTLCRGRVVHAASGD